MKIAIAQLNYTIGDIDHNVFLIKQAIHKASAQECKLIIFSELAITGYPPRDFLLSPDLIDKNLEALNDIASLSQDITIICGYVDKNTANFGRTIYNALAVCTNKTIVERYYKQLLPTYDIFDESRYFEPGNQYKTLDIEGHKIVLTICEDIWSLPQYKQNIYQALQPSSADILINISASPYTIHKFAQREKLLTDLAHYLKAQLIYVNQVGGHDELIFDGGSMVINPQGHIALKGKFFQEDFIVFDTETQIPQSITKLEPLEELKQALILGLRDYIKKCGFSKVLLGLSGGIDSALTAVLAVEALGKDAVKGILLPSRYSSESSITDAVQLSQNLGIQHHIIPIDNIFTAFLKEVNTTQTPCMDLAEENLQARIRGNILMTLSNREGSMLLTTGNKSELATGYCTLYGDMCGGLAVISDLTKTLVYKLSVHINSQQEMIPHNILLKAPSAELRPNQKDQDSLPPYDLLDEILEVYLNKETSVKNLLLKYPADLVQDVIAKVNNTEYKRIQSAPGLKVTDYAFGIGRRIPIAQKFKDILKNIH